MLPVRRHLNRWRFLENVIEIFVQAIEQKTEKFLGIVLIGSSELRRDSADILAERHWRQESVLLSPDGAQELRDGIGECTLRA